RRRHGSDFVPAPTRTSRRWAASRTRTSGWPTVISATGFCWPRQPPSASRRTSFPLGERVQPRLPAIADQVRQKPAAAKQFFQQALERLPVAFDPFRRRLLMGLIDDFLGEVYDLVQPGL